MKKLLRKNDGFTLIELMIVVVIIGILAAIAIPNFLRYQLKSRSGEAPINLKGIFTSETAFGAKYGGYAVAGPTAAAPGSAAYVWDETLPAFQGFVAMGFKSTGSVRFCYAADGAAPPADQTAHACGAPAANTNFPVGGGGLPAALGGYTNNAVDVWIKASADLDNDGAFQTQFQNDEQTNVAVVVATTGEVSGEALF